MATLAKRGQSVVADSPAAAFVGQSSLFDGSPGTNPATYCSWSSNTSLGVGWIEVSGFDFASGLASGDTLNSVTVTLRHQESSTLRFSGVVIQPYSGGSTVGSSFACGMATSVRTDNQTVGAVTMAQLRSSDFKIRVTATRTSGTTGSIFYIDHVDVTADYTAGVTAGGKPKVYVSGSFQKKPLKVYNSTSGLWEVKPLKVYNGTSWVTVT